jgi:hypothetical protein
VTCQPHVAHCAPCHIYLENSYLSMRNHTYEFSLHTWAHMRKVLFLFMILSEHMGELTPYLQPVPTSIYQTIPTYIGLV